MVMNIMNQIEHTLRFTKLGELLLCLCIVHFVIMPSGPHIVGSLVVKEEILLHKLIFSEISLNLI